MEQTAELSKRKKGWTAEAQAWVIAQGKAGICPAQLPKPLFELFGLVKTRNAITGVFFRAGISVSPSRTNAAKSDAARAELRRRRRQLQRDEARKTAAPSRSLPPPVPVVDIDDLTIPIAKRRSIEQLDIGSCHWPLGDVGTPGFGYCPHTAAPGRRYCAGHYTRAYQPPRQPRSAPQPSPTTKRIPTFDDHLQETG